MRWRSRCSISARNCLPLRLSSCRWSSSGSAPRAMTPPSASEIGRLGNDGFFDSLANVARARRWRRAVVAAVRRSMRPSAARTAGIFPSEADKAIRSRGIGGFKRHPAEQPLEIEHARRALAAAPRGRWSACTALQPRPAARLISLASIAGRSIHARSRRLPMGVTVASRERNSVTPASVPAKRVQPIRGCVP